MTDKELMLLLETASKIYSNFNVSDDQTFNIWFTLLQDVPFGVAMANLKHHMQTSEYAPKPANLAYMPQEELSWHQYQQQEAEQSRLALQAYHENEDVKPMPDYIREKLERIKRRARGEEA